MNPDHSGAPILTRANRRSSMKPGTRPKPTHLKLVTGNPGKRPLPTAEARVAPALPSPPPHLSDDAKVEWSRVSEELYKAGLLSSLDRAALAAYCQAHGRWSQAERAIAEMGKRDMLTGGLMIKTSNGNAIQNPLVGTANKAMSDMVRYAAEFGMTPSARTSITATPPDGKDPAAEYLT
jgi:P27 family predicted phage terminase small subunit